MLKPGEKEDPSIRQPVVHQSTAGRIRTAITFALIVFALLPRRLSAQQIINVSGGTGTAANVSLDWSVGELTRVDELRSAEVWLSQGLLQPYDTTSSSLSAGYQLLIFPNPTPGLVTVRAGFPESGLLTLRLFDMAGRLIKNQANNYTALQNYPLDLTGLADGVYALAVYWKGAPNHSWQSVYMIIKY